MTQMATGSQGLFILEDQARGLPARVPAWLRLLAAFIPLLTSAIAPNGWLVSSQMTGFTLLQAKKLLLAAEFANSITDFK
jgi:hypothetical protein